MSYYVKHIFKCGDGKIKDYQRFVNADKKTNGYGSPLRYHDGICDDSCWNYGSGADWRCGFNEGIEKISKELQDMVIKVWLATEEWDYGKANKHTTYLEIKNGEYLVPERRMTSDEVEYFKKTYGNHYETTLNGE